MSAKGKKTQKLDLVAKKNAETLARLTPEIMNLFYRLTNGMSCPEQLTIPQFKVLQFLDQAGRPLKMSELSELVGVAQSTLTETIKKLVTAGLMSRERSAQDDRVVYLSLNAKSRAILEEHADSLAKFFTKVCAHIGVKNSSNLIKCHDYVLSVYKQLLESEENS